MEIKCGRQTISLHKKTNTHKQTLFNLSNSVLVGKKLNYWIEDECLLIVDEPRKDNKIGLE